MDNRSSCGSASVIVSGERKQLTSAKPMQCKSMQQQHHHHQCHSSTLIEQENVSQTASIDGKVSMNDLRNTIQKLENVKNYCFNISFVDHVKAKIFLFVSLSIRNYRKRNQILTH